MRVCHLMLSGVRCPAMFIVWTVMHIWRVSVGHRATDAWTGVMHLLFVRLIVQRYTQEQLPFFLICQTKGRLQKIKTSYLVTLSKRVGRGMDQITIFLTFQNSDMLFGRGGQQ